MNIDEAIKNNKQLLENIRFLESDRQSIQLGIEALERIRDIRKSMTGYPEQSYWFREFGLDKLPSETEGD